MRLSVLLWGLLLVPGDCHRPITQFLIQWADRSEAAEDVLSARVDTVAQDTGVPVQYLRLANYGYVTVELTTDGVPHADVPGVKAALLSHPLVAIAEPNLWVTHFGNPNDPLYPSQWHYHGMGMYRPGPTNCCSAPTPIEVQGLNLPDAWAVTTGGNVIVAVVDTGVLPHPDLVDNLIKPGYSMISDPNLSHDGLGRNPNGTDPGDWSLNPDGTINPSSWHGTHVSGTVAAVTNNSVGVAGVGWNTRVLSVRCLGSGGGLLADCADAITWAAGLSVTGSPMNPTPAQVVSLSLGVSSLSYCDAYTQAAIDSAVAAGVTVVVAAGNDGTDAAFSSPCNCNNVICVGALQYNGLRTSYSNYGAPVSIMAPGGEPYYDVGAITTLQVLSTYNFGTEGPGAYGYPWRSGTSMARPPPHVSGLAPLILSVAPTTAPAAMKSLIQSTARDFNNSYAPIGSACDPSICGAGIADATAAIYAAIYGSCTACDINARCSQATRPFACQCLPGFEGNGSYCLGPTPPATTPTPTPTANTSPSVRTPATTTTTTSGGSKTWLWGLFGLLGLMALLLRCCLYAKHRRERRLEAHASFSPAAPGHPVPIGGFTPAPTPTPAGLV